MKKILLLVFAIVMIASCFVFSSYAVTYDSTKCKGGYVATKIESEYVNSSKSVISNTYNDKGYLVKTTKDDTINGIEKTTYSYDKIGRLTKEKYNHGYSINGTYSYNSDGTLKKELSYTNLNLDWDLFLNVKYTYNSKGQLTKLDGSGYDYDEISKYSYNSKGQIVKSIMTSGYDTSGGSHTYKYYYDKTGKITKIVFSPDWEGNTQTTTYSYNSKGQLTKEKTTCSYGTDEIQYTYNNRGDVIKEIRSGYLTQYTLNNTYTYKKVSSSACVIEGDIHFQYTSTAYTGKAKKPNVTIDGLKNGVDYKVTYSNNVKVGTAKAKITFLGASATREPITITFKITTAKPTNLKASSTTSNSTKLSWTKSAGATGYVVYKYVASEKKYVKLGVVSGNSYTVKNLKAGTSYKFAVRAYTKTSSGNSYSGYSSLISVKTK